MKAVFILCVFMFMNFATAAEGFPIGGKIFDKSNSADYLQMYCIEDRSFEECSQLYIRRSNGYTYFLDKRFMPWVFKKPTWGVKKNLHPDLLERSIQWTVLSLFGAAYLTPLAVVGDILKFPVLLIMYTGDYFYRLVAAVKSKKALRILTGRQRRLRAEYGLGTDRYEFFAESLYDLRNWRLKPGCLFKDPEGNYGTLFFTKNSLGRVHAHYMLQRKNVSRMMLPMTLVRGGETPMYEFPGGKLWRETGRYFDHEYLEFPELGFKGSEVYCGNVFQI